ncbi:hypothetical protein EGH21_22300 [Halomicroarcula sp. F13]|uniref:Uncharacterized protein n=1 Tax=Haloarcula rubra TaxID=2487747 RepID=A0AAW4PZS4_9EURY|nr:hypothetical protein [Halomicroarcula rubra]MBX0325752.1 hypothetical protein [Halomicroarcula rubra]
MAAGVTGRDTVPDCPNCDRRLAIVNADTFACYNCLTRFARDGPGRVGGVR